MEEKYALEGIKVVDFTWQYTGPIVTKFLAHHGAEVIKVESQERPDGGRGYSPYKDDKPGINRSAVFANYNTGKYGITLNLKQPKAIEIVKKLVARADVFLESYRPGTMERLGLGYPELKKVKPDLVYVSMSMQGQTGPLARQLTLGFFFQGALGFTHFTGWPDRDPVGVPVAYPDYITPWYMLFSVLLSLDYRRRTGKGLYIDFSQLESSVHFVTPALLDYIVNGRIQTRCGNRSTRAAPHGAYPCQGKERWCAVAVFTDEEWKAFCRVVGTPEWTRDPRFATLSGRMENAEELEKLISEWTANHSAEEVMTALQAAGVAAGVVQNGQDVVERDPQLKHRKHFQEMEHRDMGNHLFEVPPVRLSRTPGGLTMPAPCLGEHNEFVCCEILGMSGEEFAELMAAGVIA
ncbi:MAG: CoA transferase [Chloroflexota bacterium]